MKTEDMSKPMTEGKFQYYFESIKDLIRSSTAEIKTDVAELKTDVAELKTDVGELKRDVGILKVAVGEHTKLIKGLDKKIDTVHARDVVRIDDHETRIAALEHGA